MSGLMRIEKLAEGEWMVYLPFGRYHATKAAQLVAYVDEMRSRGLALVDSSIPLYEEAQAKPAAHPYKKFEELEQAFLAKYPEGSIEECTVKGKKALAVRFNKEGREYLYRESNYNLAERLGL